MNMISLMRRDINLMGTTSLDINEFNQLQAEWIKRCSMEPQKPDAVLSKSTDLLCCPFCGGDAEYWTSQEDEQYPDIHIVDCAECECNIGYHGTEEAAKEAWNKRAI